MILILFIIINVKVIIYNTVKTNDDSNRHSNFNNNH